MLTPDTLTFRTSTAFDSTVSMLEAIFNVEAQNHVKNGHSLRHVVSGTSYVLNLSILPITKHFKIKVTQYTKPSSSGLYHTFVQFYGMNQYSKDGTPHEAFSEYQKQLQEFIETVQPQLWDIQIPIDFYNIPFDEVVAQFPTFEQRYKTSFYGHKKGSTIAKQFCLYSKTEKNKLELNITRLELTHSYARRRSPLIVTTFEELEKEVTKVESYLVEYASATNVYTQAIHPNNMPPEFSSITNVHTRIIKELYLTSVQSLINPQNDLITIVKDSERLYYHTKLNLLLYSKHQQDIVTQLCHPPTTSPVHKLKKL